MKRFVYASLVTGSALLAGSFSAFAGPGHEGGHNEGDQKMTTIIGEAIDTACFTASDGDAKGKDHAECAQKCMSTGIPAGILPEGKTAADALMLLTNPKPFAPYAAQTIKVEGTSYPERHAFDVKKAYVKDGENWKEIQLDDEHHKMGGGEQTGNMKGTDAKDGAKGDGHTNHKH